MQFVVFEKFTSAYLFQIAWEKSVDYLLIIYKWQFLSRFSILCDKWRVKVLQLYWMKIWHVNSSIKIYSLSPRHVWKLSGFLIAWEKQSLFTFEFQNVTRKQKKTSLWFWCGLLQWLKQTLCRVQVYLRKETLQPTQVALTKMQRNEAKIYQETDFLSTEGHLLTSSGCFLTLTSSLDVVQVRFTFVAFCLWAIKSPSFILSQT